MHVVWSTACNKLVAVYPLSARDGGRDITQNGNQPARLRGVYPAPGPDGQPLAAYRFTGKRNSFIEFQQRPILWYLINIKASVSKREMFGYQTSSNIVWLPNILMLKCVAKRLKHVWSNS